MKIIGVIPARYRSSRFPGKPLADICGRPMIWWVYRQAKKVEQLDAVYVATDDERIQAACESYGIPVKSASGQAYKLLAQNVMKGTKKLYDVTRKYSGFFGSIRRSLKRSV